MLFLGKSWKTKVAHYAMNNKDQGFWNPIREVDARCVECAWKIQAKNFVQKSVEKNIR